MPSKLNSGWWVVSALPTHAGQVNLPTELVSYQRKEFLVKGNNSLSLNKISCQRKQFLDNLQGSFQRNSQCGPLRNQIVDEFLLHKNDFRIDKK